jgi:hypothetical protein
MFWGGIGLVFLLPLLMEIDMQKMRVWFMGLLLSFFALTASAAGVSVLDTAATTAITGGLDDLQATILGLVNLAWPYLIAVAVVLMAPRLVSKIIHVVGRG